MLPIAMEKERATIPTKTGESGGKPKNWWSAHVAVNSTCEPLVASGAGTRVAM